MSAVSRFVDSVLLAPHDYMNQFGDDPREGILANALARPESKITGVIGGAVTAGTMDPRYFFAFLGGLAAQRTISAAFNRLYYGTDENRRVPVLYYNPTRRSGIMANDVAKSARREERQASNVNLGALTATAIATSLIGHQDLSLLGAFTIAAASAVVVHHTGRMLRAQRALTSEWTASVDKRPPPRKRRQNDLAFEEPAFALPHV